MPLLRQPTPDNDDDGQLDEAVAIVVEAGREAGRETTPGTPDQRAARRRRSVERSKARVPYGRC